MYVPIVRAEGQSDDGPPTARRCLGLPEGSGREGGDELPRVHLPDVDLACLRPFERDSECINP